jgi:hypothetical protein
MRRLSDHKLSGSSNLLEMIWPYQLPEGFLSVRQLTRDFLVQPFYAQKPVVGVHQRRKGPANDFTANILARSIGGEPNALT